MLNSSIVRRNVSGHWNRVKKNQSRTTMTSLILRKGTCLLFSKGGLILQKLCWIACFHQTVLREKVMIQCP